MKGFLSALLAKIGLFASSIALGALSYCIYQEVEGSALLAHTSPSHIAGTPLDGSEIPFDAEAHLLALVDSPADVAGDALGVYYILESDGDLVRVAPGLNGGEASSYASFGDDRTLAGAAFTAVTLHPNFLLKEESGYGRFYILVSEKPGSRNCDFTPEFGGGREHHQDVLYEYTVEDPLLSEFRGTRRELMRFSQPGPDHNVCGLAFDPDGHLYIGVGDGDSLPVSAKSASRNASSLMNAFGKVLRIDPLGMNASNGQYGIPATNPFRLVSNALPELWVFGLRAPRSLTYDPFRRGLCISDRSGDRREQVNLSLDGGEHFGWDIVEAYGRLGRADRDRLAEVVTEPEVTVNLDSGLFATTSGSLVYRGENFPSLTGALLLASHDGQLLARKSGDRGLSRIHLGGLSEERFSGLRQGPRGEMILLCEDGKVLELRKGASLGTGSSKHRALFCSVDRF